MRGRSSDVQPADATRKVKQVKILVLKFLFQRTPPPPPCRGDALASQQAVQALLGALLVLVVGDGRGEVVVVLLQDGDDVVVAELHRFIHRRVAPPVHEKNKVEESIQIL